MRVINYGKKKVIAVFKRPNEEFTLEEFNQGIKLANHEHNFNKRKFCEKGCCEWLECECGEKQYIRIG